MKQIKLTQKKEDCHYETTLWETRLGGWYPIRFGFGFSQSEADSNLIKQVHDCFY